MADFAQWSVACETAWWPTGTFLAVYAKNQQEAVEEMVDSDVVANSIHLLAQASLQWDGTPSELLLVLNEIAGEQTTKSNRSTTFSGPNRDD